MLFRSIKDSEEAQGLINAHPVDVRKRLNSLKEKIEDEEWSIVLGSIVMEIDYQAQQLIFNAVIAGHNIQSIRIALDLTKEDT